MFEIQILTLFPEVLVPFLSASLLGKGAEKGILKFGLTQIRDFATDRHRTVDDTPYGGGPGMVLRADVLHAAWKSVAGDLENPRTVLLSPQGKRFDHTLAREWAKSERPLILVCGHYEGVDERFVELCVDEEVSIGDYVLTGGELAAGVIADACSRWVGGVVGQEASVSTDSLEGDLLKYPQYTRPRLFEGLEVPSVLLSGDHARISEWRQVQSEGRTQLKRPDLWARRRKGMGS